MKINTEVVINVIELFMIVYDDYIILVIIMWSKHIVKRII